MKRVLISLGVCAFVAVGAFAAGQEEDITDEGPVEIVIWTGIVDEQGPNQLIERFEAENPDIDVVHRRYVNNQDGNTKLDTALIGQEQVDLFVSYSLNEFQRRANNGLIQSLDPFIEEDGDFSLAEDFGQPAETTTIDGTTYGLPVAVGNDVVWYNKTRLDEVGFEVTEDWTWQDFREASRRAIDRNADPVRYGSMMFPWGAFLWDAAAVVHLGADPYYAEDGTSSNFTNPVFRDLLNVHYQLEQVDESQVPLAELTATRLSPQVEFVRGNAYMIGPTSGWILRYVKNTEEYPHDFVTGIAPIPRLSEQDGERYYRLRVTDMLGMSAKTEHPEETWRFLKFFATEGYIEHTPFGRIPAWNGFTSEDIVSKLIAEDERYLFDMESFENYLLPPSDANFAIYSETTARPQVGEIATEGYQSVLLGEKELDEAITSAQERADEAIQQALERDE